MAEQREGCCDVRGYDMMIVGRCGCTVAVAEAGLCVCGSGGTHWVIHTRQPTSQPRALAWEVPPLIPAQCCADLTRVRTCVALLVYQFASGNR